MATLAELEQAEQAGTIGPKGKAALAQYRASQAGAVKQPTTPAAASKPPTWLQSAGEAAIRTSGQLAGPFTRPILGLVGQGEQLAGIAPNPATFPMPRFMGGDVTVDKPTSLKGIEQTVGSIGEGAINYLLPGSATGREMLGAAGAAKSGAMLMGGNQAAQSISQGDAPLPGFLKTGAASLLGAGIGKAADVVSNPEQLQGLKDYAFPRAKANSLAEQIAEGVQASQEKERAMTVETKTLGLQKKQLQTERTAGTQLGKVQQSALETEWDGKIADADAKLNEAIEKNLPNLKSQIIKVHNNMTKAYGEAIAEASKGKEFLGSDFKAKVVQPVIDMMQEDGVPESSAVFKKLNGLEIPDVMDANSFKHIRDQVMEGVSSAVKEGRASASLADRWPIQVNRLQGQFVQEYAPELAKMNQDYARMAFARKKLYSKTAPLNENDITGATRMLSDIASGKPLDPTTRAVIKLAEEGRGKIPGIGKGAIAKPIAGPAGEAALRRQQYEAVSGQLKEQLGIEKQKLTSQITNIETRLKEIGLDRANVQQQKNDLSALRVKKARLQKIAAWESGLMKAGLTALGAGGAGYVYEKARGMP